MLVMPRNREHELEIIRQMAYGRQVDGFLVQDSGDGDEERLDLLMRSERPFVMMGGVGIPEVNSVTFNMQSFASDIAGILKQRDCGSVVLLMPQSLNRRVLGPFLDYFEKWSATEGIACESWSGAFIPDGDWFAAKARSLGGKKLGIALLRGLLPETLNALNDGGVALNDSAWLVYVSAGEEMLLVPNGLSVLYFDNYSLGRRAARLLLNVIDSGKTPPKPESLVISAAQKG